MLDEENIYVITRTGKKELLDPNQITKRLLALINKEPKIQHVNPYELMLHICSRLKSNITTYEIDEYAANVSASLSISNPHYMKLASRIAIDNHQKNTKRSFLDKTLEAYLCKDNKGNVTSLVSETYCKYVEKHQDFIEKNIDYNRDFLLDFFGFRTFQRSFGIRIDTKVIERPQDVFMRCAVAIHMNTQERSDKGIAQELELIKQTYDSLSNKQFTHASPTYFNSGSQHQQLSSCFLLGTEDSLDGIKDTDKNMARISKWGGGIGVHINNWRSRGSIIRSTNGESNGIVPFLKEYNATMKAWNQGGKRPGSAAIYLMPHHPDIVEFLKLRMPGGVEEDRARDLFYAIWIPDIFMERVKINAKWSLFDPDQTEDLSNYYNESKTHNTTSNNSYTTNNTLNRMSYTEKYLQLESEKRYKSQINARELWELLFKSNQQTGMPYICFSDTANQMSMQKNLGTIKSSNLCAEIMLYSDSKEYAVCNLASISLVNCVIDVYNDDDLKLDESKRRQLDHAFPLNPYFDYKKLMEVVKIIVRNLNNVIEKNFYPCVETYRSNMRHRPIGVGVQGLADTYMKMRYPFDSEQARQLNKLIFETIYFSAVSQSTYLAREKYMQVVQECKMNGVVKIIDYMSELLTQDHKEITYTDPTQIPYTIGSYPSMLYSDVDCKTNNNTTNNTNNNTIKSPISQGIFHWELYGSSPSSMYDWQTLREHILQYGVRNSVLVALMPTATTSQLLSNNECFEPYTSNIYKRKTLAGEYIIINKWLINDLYRLNLWNTNIKDYLIACEGSIRMIEGIPDELKQLYKTAWEINQEELVQQAIDRQPYVDQAMSLNWYLENVTLDQFNKLAFKAWNGKLKTGKYYLHSRPASTPQKFSIDPALQKSMEEQLEKEKHQRNTSFMDPLKDECLLCSA